ncbi:MAG: alpha-glucan family phosphorylase [Burkholderiales bacterium]
MEQGTHYVLEVNPRIPTRLARLEELANNLWYSWDRPTRELFARLHPALWSAVGHSPKAFLKRIDERRLVAAAEDQVFLTNFGHVLSAYDSYHGQPARRNGAAAIPGDELVAYFCAEFGFHESLPIYSGGLGILAGDHCKAASDMRLPFVGVGLLYRQGYFFQTVDSEGQQHAAYADSDFDDLPISPVLLDGGAQARVAVELPGRSVHVQVWQVRVGHVRLLLLDTDLLDNSTRDRGITHRLYGGDRSMRIEQEIVLGIGGVRALAALGLRPTVWHINEGHAAFQVLERIRTLFRQGLEFDAALEAVAACTVFTTHTAVPAGHDHFAEGMIGEYFDGYCRELGIAREKLMSLGRTTGSADFNMTALAVHGSRFQNGVSRIHGEVSANMLAGLWPQVPADENPLDYITNGVHVPTFLAVDWADAFARFLGVDWTQHLHDAEWWERIDSLPDQIFWSVHQFLKARMLHLVGYRVRKQHFRNSGSEAHLDRMLALANPDDPNVLTVGFGRRFATYKRAALLFQDLDWLKEILCDPEHPVLFIFTGRAHPADGPGQELIRRVVQISRMPEFEGKILFVEGYDLRLARRLVSGVDVWLNNPVYPLEASGTSGMKAAMNGVINLSVLDGWWGEGYERGNGWAIKPIKGATDDRRRDSEEARTLYEILQDQVVPLYYRRGKMGYSPEWIRMAKRSMATILPRFNSARMLHEYLSKFYVPGAKQGHLYADAGHAAARDLAAWKARVRAAWPGVALRRLDSPRRRIQYGDSVLFEVAAKLNGLEPEDVVIEVVISPFDEDVAGCAPVRQEFVADGTRSDAGEHHFTLQLAPEMCGRLDYRIRCYPRHRHLTHRFELGLMLWA